MLRSLQPTIHVIFSLFFYLTVFLSTSLDAKIIQVPSLYCLEKHLESQDTWVILDVDEVLLVAEDPILQRLQRPVFWSLFKKYTEGMPKEKQDAVVAILKTSGLDNKLGKGLVAQTLKAITDA